MSLTTPTNGSTFTNGQPDFAGQPNSGFGFTGQLVTVDVYSGSSASGTPVQTLNAIPGAGGAYSVVPNTPLGNGQYTAQAEQSDIVGDLGKSSPVTFTLDDTGPTLSLSSLGSRPLLTASPTLTGTAGTRAQDSKSVVLVIFAGGAPTGSPVRVVTGSARSNGAFSIPVTPALADGQYTAVAAQQGGGSVGFSNPVTFRVKVHPPALMVSHPTAGGSVPRSDLFFSGKAGNEFGDSSSITIYIYRGSKVRGNPLGKRTVSENGSSWSTPWGRKLKDGIYTLRAVQTDDAGHTTRITHTFIVVPAPTTIGSFVSLSRSRVASVPISCLAPSGISCTSSVLIVTTRHFSTNPGGPSGSLRVSFAYVQLPGGSTHVTSGVVPSEVARVLRSDKGVKVQVTTMLSTSGGPISTLSAKRSLQLK